ALDVRDVETAPASRHHDGAQMKQRYGSLPSHAEDALLDPEQAILAIEDQRTAQRAEQSAGREDDDSDDHRPHDAEREQPEAGRGQSPAGPRGRARQLELDAALRPVANLNGAEPVEHDSSLRCSPRIGYSVSTSDAGAHQVSTSRCHR